MPASDVVVPKKIDTQREGASIYQREFLVYRLARVQNTGGQRWREVMPREIIEGQTPRWTDSLRVAKLRVGSGCFVPWR